jgi:hypothetical protein
MKLSALYEVNTKEYRININFYKLFSLISCPGNDKTNVNHEPQSTTA